LAGTLAIPDEIFWQRVENAMLERHGRILDDSEITVALANESSDLAKLAKESPK
jgi:hypothetical protein